MKPEPAASGPAAKPPRTDTSVLIEFMFRLGQAYLGCGEQTAKVELLLRRTASAYGMRRSRVVAFPTAVFISVHDKEGERVTLAECEPQTMRLDQMADVYRLGEAAQSGQVEPAEGLQKLTAILRQDPRFGPVGAIAGHTILTIGLALVLMPTLTNLAAASVLGLIVGLIKLSSKGRGVLAVPLPVIAAIVVSILVFLAIRRGLPVDPLHALVPPLVTFLPGGMLTLGMVELAYGDMVSGASRLIAGFVQLVLLVFGLAIGAALVGYRPEDLVNSAGFYVQLPLASWAGVLVFGLGVYLHFSAPRNSLHWMMLVLLCAFGAQRLAAGVFNSEISGFFGTLVATPLGYLIQLRFRGPPAAVTFLPSFWLLVPGALGLLSVARILSDRAAGIDGLVTVVFVITSIALGTLVGAAMYKWLTERFGWWQLQVGRVGSYFRRANKR
ncbi:MAG: threonine/serine exporter family protein [Verrucomicrobia bacterium]|nr:threonine/serine exporter family protein [Verrucomicrobiota bacterium]